MNAKQRKRAARDAVASIIADLDDRRGLHVSELDRDVQREIKARWRTLIEAAIINAGAQ